LFTDQEKEILRRSWSQLVPLADSCADVFYRRLFELRPDYRTLFPLDMSGQKRKLMRAFALVVKSLDFPDAEWQAPHEPRHDLLLIVLALGRRHEEFYRIPTDSYVAFGEAWIATLEQVLGEAFSAEARAVWLKLYALLVIAMRLGAATVDEQADSISSEEAQQLGEQALVNQLAATGLEARLGLGGEPQ
jgi:nitric oxide dioxygenase